MLFCFTALFCVYRFRYGGECMVQWKKYLLFHEGAEYVRRDDDCRHRYRARRRGIGIIRLSGVSALEIADKIFHTGKIKTFKEAVPRMMYFGHVTDGEKRIDEGLAVYMKAPHSYTGENVVEIQIHGSAEALRETLSLALRSGAVPAMRGEFTKRAF